MGEEKELRKVVMTRCPVGGGTELLFQKGWLEAAYRDAGAEIVMLQSFPKEEHKKHYSLEAPLAFRDGGNVPPIWSRSIGVKTKVIGLSAIKQSHAIIVAIDSAIKTPEDLRGKRLSVPRTTDSAVDPMRAMTLWGYQTILEGYGIDKSEVSFVDTIVDKQKNSCRVDIHGNLLGSETGAHAKDFVGHHVEEIAALRAGEIDAFFSHRSLVGQIESKGLGRVLIDIAKTDLPNINNIYPAIITVSQEFAEKNRDLVIVYLKELLKAADWEKDHQREALEIGAKGQYGATYEDLLETRVDGWDDYFAPSFDGKLVDYLRQQKQFLLENHFIENDFDLDDWMAPGFLEEAKRLYHAG